MPPGGPEQWGKAETAPAYKRWRTRDLDSRRGDSKQFGRTAPFCSANRRKIGDYAGRSGHTLLPRAWRLLLSVSAGAAHHSGVARSSVPKLYPTRAVPAAGASGASRKISKLRAVNTATESESHPRLQKSSSQHVCSSSPKSWD